MAYLGFQKRGGGKFSLATRAHSASHKVGPNYDFQIFPMVKNFFAKGGPMAQPHPHKYATDSILFTQLCAIISQAYIVGSQCCLCSTTRVFPVMPDYTCLLQLSCPFHSNHILPSSGYFRSLNQFPISTPLIIFFVSWSVSIAVLCRLLWILRSGRFERLLQAFAKW